jgi:hypothetical protein
MSDNIQIVFKNDKELLKLFTELNPQVQKKVVVEAMRKSAKIILEEAKKNYNLIKKNNNDGKYKLEEHYIPIDKSFKTLQIRDKMGVRVGLMNYRGGWIDRGTKDRYYTTKKGKKHNLGKMTKTNFFYNAVDKRKDEAMSTLNDNLILSMERLVKKYN